MALQIDATDRDMIDRGDRIGAALARGLLAHYDDSNEKIARLESMLERKQDLFDALVSFVHRWTWDKVGNGTTDAERLDVIKHYPPIAHRSLPVVAPTTAGQP